MSNSPTGRAAQTPLLSRRGLLQAGTAGVALLRTAALPADAPQRPSALQTAIDQLPPYFTPQDGFRDVSRGKPLPHSLPDEKMQAVGLTRETWKLEVLSDPESPTKLRTPLTQENGKALDFAALMKLAETRAVRFPKVMTCLNIGCPLGMGIWEGVPLRDVLWLAGPREDLRRVFYYGYHNDDPAQMFRSSLPAGRVLEDYFGLPPVILCYKLNGEWLTSERGGPVRIVAPEHYGFKNVKWLTHVVLSNIPFANDTYAEKNNDVDSPLKTFAATIGAPAKVAADTPFPIAGYAQVGVSGLSKVQFWLHPAKETWPAEDGDFLTAPWQDAEILPPPASANDPAWGRFPDGRLPLPLHGFDADGRPKQWPLPLTKVHWAALLPAVPAGDYVFRSRTIDAQGTPQPLPRPFRKSGFSGIETVRIRVEG